MKIGLVGLGRMGGAMSQRLREQGFEVVGWDANADRNKALGNSGLRIAANPRAIAAESEIIISIITEDHGVRRIFRGPEGFLRGDVAGKLFIEMSTLQPMTGRELAPFVESMGCWRCGLSQGSPPPLAGIPWKWRGSAISAITRVEASRSTGACA